MFLCCPPRHEDSFVQGISVLIRPAFAMLWVSMSPLLRSQEPAAPPPSPAPSHSALRLFLDVQQAMVDEAFLKTELPWVDWVRQPEQGEVHLILTTRPNGGGGTAYMLRFLGRGPFVGVDDELTYHSRGTSSPDDIRRGLAAQVSLGLARYVARRPGAERMGVVLKEGAASVAPPPGKDPWNAWVYQVALNGFFNGESNYSAASTSANLSANRITEKDIFRFSANGNWNSTRYVLSDQTLRTRTESYTSNLVYAKGVSDHWTWGIIGSGERSTQNNMSASLRLAPAVEYNLWTYGEATQRQLTFLYQVGALRNRYFEETIYGKTSETLFDNSLAVTLSLNQPWGTVSTSLTGAAYLNDGSKNSIALSNFVSLRLGKGFSLNLSGIYSRVRNQLSLPREGATDEEILLRLRQLQTSYTYFASIGISYTFGSIFNNAVNTRFKSAGGGGGNMIIISQ